MIVNELSTIQDYGRQLVEHSYHEVGEATVALRSNARRHSLQCHVSAWKGETGKGIQHFVGIVLQMQRSWNNRKAFLICI